MNKNIIIAIFIASIIITAGCTKATEVQPAPPAPTQVQPSATTPAEVKPNMLKPAKFTLVDLTVTPDQPKVWQEITVTVKVKNIGEVEGVYMGSLRIGGSGVQTKDVKVPAENEATLTFTFMKEVGPSCNIGIGELSRTVSIKEGVPASLKAGDKWVSKQRFEGTEYVLTLKVTGESVIDGKECYVMEGSFEPPFQGIMSSASMKFDKATMFVLSMQSSGEVNGSPFSVDTNHSYDISGQSYYPLEIGNECKIKETETTNITMMGKTETTVNTNIYTYKVESMEEVIVPAGVFRCFKIVKYNEDGTSVSTSWESDKVKCYSVKEVDLKSGETTELLSYSFS